MSEITIIGVDVAKRVFQLHGARADGSVGFRKKLSRSQLLSFLAEQPRCIVAMEACATAHGWGREIESVGHTVRLIPPAYVKPFVKRQKNDAADAEAIVSTAEQNQADGRRKSLPTGDRELMVGHGARLGTRAPQKAGVCQGALA